MAPWVEMDIDTKQIAVMEVITSTVQTITGVGNGFMVAVGSIWFGFPVS
jgi:hypothetical protein